MRRKCESRIGISKNFAMRTKTGGYDRKRSRQTEKKLIKASSRKSASSFDNAVHQKGGSHFCVKQKSGEQV